MRSLVIRLERVLPLLVAGAALALLATRFRLQSSEWDKPYATFSIWDMATLAQAVAAVGIVAGLAVLVRRSSHRTLASVTCALALLVTMTIFGPSVSGVGEQITGCYQVKGCIIDEATPLADHVRGDKGLHAKLRAEDGQTIVFASPPWTLVYWLTMLAVVMCGFVAADRWRRNSIAWVGSAAMGIGLVAAAVPSGRASMFAGSATVMIGVTAIGAGVVLFSRGRIGLGLAALLPPCILAVAFLFVLAAINAG